MISDIISYSNYRKNNIDDNSQPVVRLFLIIFIIFAIILLSTRFLLSDKVSGEIFGNNIPIGRVSDLGQAQPAIAIDNDGNIYVIWAEENTSTLIFTMWIAKSTNGGTSFDFVKRINEEANWSQEQPSIAVGPNGKVHVVWIDREATVPGIYYANSTDGGLSFNPNVRVMDNTAPCGFGGSVTRRLIAVDKNNKIHVVWSDNRTGGNYSIYYTNSTDGGISFNPNINVSDNDAHAFEPSVAADENGNIYVVWTDYRDISTKGKDIYFSRSSDGGISFNPNKRVNDDLGKSEQLDVSIAVNNGLIGVVWDDWRSGGEDIYFANSTDGGENFGPNKKLNDDIPGANWLSSIAINRTGYIGVVWEDGRNGNWDIYFANSTDGGATFSANQRLNDDTGTEYQYTPHIAMDDNGRVYVVWQDYRNGINWDIYLCRSNIPPLMAAPNLPQGNSTIVGNPTTLEVTPVTDPDNDTVYYNFTISDQTDAESGTVYYSGWITSTSWEPLPLPDGKWYWHTYTSDMWNTTAPNWVWNFTIDTSQSYFIQLYEGWNLISIPFIQVDTDLTSVLNSINGSYDAVQWYNTGDNSDHWKHNHISKSSQLNDLDDIDHKMGIWVHVTEPGGILFQCSGIIPDENQTISLKSGWNLVGYPSLSNKTRDVALNNLFYDTDVDAIWTYNASSQKWEQIGEFDYFERGRGYWIHAKTDCEWEVPI